ncbi:MAG TPA: hypothetical protein ENK11_06615 [Phycisphaerales bacterium]|nr:hypothetical protein [Phycisphaerales bacterium]
MSGFLGWLKSNILIVVFCVLIIVLPPAGFVGSSMWNASIKKKVEEKLSTKKRAVDGVARVRYTLPPISPDEQPFELSRPPNAVVTAFFADKRAERQSMIESVVKRAVLFNKKEDREVLLPGLFPGMDDDREERRRVKEMARLIAGDDETPSVYDGLFASINAGEPLKPEDVARRVVDAYRAALDRQGGGDIGSLPPEEQETIRKQMKAQRLSVYARRAGELSVYGSKEALYGADPSTESVIFEEVPEGSHDVTEAFIWQMDYWFVQDLLKAVRLANTTEDGLMTEIPISPVKRIVSIRLDKIEIPEEEDKDSDASAGGRGSRGGRGSPLVRPRPVARPGAGPAAEAEPSYTGRSPDDENGAYQVRRGRITLIAASDQLVRVLEAISKENFMTVIGIKLNDVDRWADLREGYFYGPDHVVRAEIEVESSWLDFWLADVVPDRVASAWKIERPDAETNKGP